jgi:hypothetical protein
MPLPRAAGSCLFDMVALQVSQRFQGPRCKLYLSNSSTSLNKYIALLDEQVQVFKDSKRERTGAIIRRDVRDIHTLERKGYLERNMNKGR